MKRFFILAWIIVLSTGISHSNKWELRTIIPSQNITSLCQDELGFIWCGGDNGLMRFDGYSTQYVPTKNANSLHTYINRIDRFDTRELVLSTSDGLYTYSPITDVLHNLADTLSSVNVTSILQLRNGQFIVTTFKGLYHFDSHFQLLATYHLHSEYTYCALEDSQGYLLVGTDAGLERLELNQTTSDASLLTRGRVKTLYIDTFQRLWMNVSSKVIYCNYPQLLQQGNGVWHSMADNVDVVSSISFNDQLWVATRGQGLLRICLDAKPYVEETIYFDKDKTELKNTIFSVLCDKEQNVWIGTIDGLYLYTSYSKHGFNILVESPNGLSSNIVSAIYTMPNNDIWVGTARGLNKLHDIHGKQIISHHINCLDTDNFVRQNRIQMIEDAGNGLFLISTKHHLLFFDPTHKQFMMDNHLDSVCNRYGLRFVRAYHRDQDGNIWMAFKEGGIGVWDRKQQSLHHIKWINYHQNLHRTIYRDPNGYVWVSSDADGLWRLTIDSALTTTTHSQLYPRSLFNNHSITAFTIANDSSIWCGTSDGIYKNFQLIPLYSVEDQTNIAAMQEDNQHNMWVVSSQGIFQVNIANGQNQYYEITHDHDLTKIGYVMGACKAPDGTIYFGGVSGLVYFHPDSIHSQQSVTTPVITRVVINNDYRATLFSDKDSVGRDINHMTVPFVLPPNDNQIAFEFSSLRYADRSNISYAYQLEGVDKDWVYTDATRRYASYTNLKPGRYTFQVRSTNNQGEDLDNIRTVRFRIRAPWYLTWWGILIILSGAAGIIYLLFSVVTLRTELKRLYFSLRSPISLLFRRRRKDEAMEKEHPYIVPIEVEEAPKDIMLINFDVELATALKTHLHEKYRVRDFQYDAEAVDYIRHQQPAVIMIAQQEDGDDAAHTCHDIIHLRKNDHTLLIPNIMIVSAIDTPECEQAAYLAGADVWLNSSASVEVIKSRIQQLVKQKQRLTEQIRQNLIVNPKQVNVMADTDIFMTNLMQMIEDNMSNDAFSVEQVAEQLHISTSSLYRKIKENTSMSPNEYIRSVRLNRAAQLLESQKYKVFEICYMVGFSDQRYFATCFKRQFGVTPKAYQGGKNDSST